ncbi:MAG TPA: DUF4328 domain-containing protein [Nakamurella sp.]
MTIGSYSPFAPPAARTVVCPRCGVRQTGSGRHPCVRCGLRLRRWVAHPPPGGPPRTVRPADAPPYTGPPAYRGPHPRWAFPPVVWHDFDQAPEQRRGPDPAGALRAAAWLAAAASVVSFVAAAAESWRFALMLEGRTKVLPGATVRSSDVFVAAAGACSVAVTTAALVVAVIAVVRTHAAAARRLGSAPSRSTAAVLARLLVPGWNLYGAGQIVTEIDRMLTAHHRPDRPPRVSRLIVCWWISWLVSAMLTLIALARGLGGSLQAIADTVQLHIAVDLAGAVCAGLGAVMLQRFARRLRQRAAIPDGWVVQEPAPTRG